MARTTPSILQWLFGPVFAGFARVLTRRELDMRYGLLAEPGPSLIPQWRDLLDCRSNHSASQRDRSACLFCDASARSRRACHSTFAATRASPEDVVIQIAKDIETPPQRTTRYEHLDSRTTTKHAAATGGFTSRSQIQSQSRVRRIEL